MKNREQIIADMCYTYRHDFGLDKPQGEDFVSQISAGMTRSERESLWKQMSQVFDNVIAPHMMFRIPDSRDLCGND